MKFRSSCAAGGELHSATVADFGDTDALIIRDMVWTDQYSATSGSSTAEGPSRGILCDYEASDEPSFL